MASPRLEIGWGRIMILFFIYICVAVFFEIINMQLVYQMSSETNLRFWEYYTEATKNPENHYIYILSQSFQIIGLLIISLIFYKWIDRPSILKLVRELYWKYSSFIYGCVLGILLISFLSLIIWVFYPSSFSYQGLSIIPIMVNLGLFILVAINEEVFARGMILGNLSQSYGKPVSLVVSSILFAIMHFSNNGLSFIGLSNLMLAGLLLGIVYFRTNNLWTAIGLHFTWNLFQGPVYGFEVSGEEVFSIFTLNFEQENIINGGSFGLEGSIITTILMVLVCGYYLWVDRKLYFSTGISLAERNLS